MRITETDIRDNTQIKTYIEMADKSLNAIGYTEHSFAHVTKVADMAKQLLLDLGKSKHEAELAWISGYMHDIGNIINRIDHAQSGAVMAFRILDKMGVDASDIAVIISAIGNHDESTAFPVNDVAAALILADKTDVRRSRVRNAADTVRDIHDRVNYAVEDATCTLNKEKTALTLEMTLNTDICPVMEYFEIFLGRMLLCRKAADKLNIVFCLNINGQKII